MLKKSAIVDALADRHGALRVEAPEPASLSLCVLASGSSGNCSVLVRSSGERRRVMLIDMGLSPRRTRRLLGELDLSLDEVDAALLTHLDGDHCHVGWAKGAPSHLTLHLHPRHLSRARIAGLRHAQLSPLEDRRELDDGTIVRTRLLEHDSLGVSTFRISAQGADLGFATDVGRVSPALVEHLQGVDTLAIESNYCQRLQLASNRPPFLKRRIMGGSGHLSNAQCAQAVRAIEPRSCVVLLHLSQQCNDRDRAAAGHAKAKYRVVISSQSQPTGWLPVARDALDLSR